MRSFWNARKCSQWVLRWNTLLAAALIPLHCFFDMAGHHFGVAMLAAVLVVLPMRTRGKAVSLAPTWQLVLFRLAGLVVVVLGGWLLGTALFDGPELHPLRAEKLRQEAIALEEQDRTERQAMGDNPPTNIPSAEDKIEMAIARIDEAIALMPTDGILYHKKGYLVMNFADQFHVADEAFLIQRILQPTGVQIPLRQAPAYNYQAQDRQPALWEDALIRSDFMTQKAPGTDLEHRHVIEIICRDCAMTPAVQRLSLPFITRSGLGLAYWVAKADLAVLDESFPEIMKMTNISAQDRKTAVAILRQRGQNDKAAAFETPPPVTP